MSSQLLGGHDRKDSKLVSAHTLSWYFPLLFRLPPNFTFIYTFLVSVLTPILPWISAQYTCYIALLYSFCYGNFWHSSDDSVSVSCITFYLLHLDGLSLLLSQSSRESRRLSLISYPIQSDSPRYHLRMTQLHCFSFRLLYLSPYHSIQSHM